MKTIDLYTTPDCGFCQKLKADLDGEEMTYATHDVKADSDMLEEMKILTVGKLTVPVTVIDKGMPSQVVAIGYQTSLAALGLIDGVLEDKETKETATLTCPDCGHKQKGEIPTESCVPFYDCEGCEKTIQATGEDCCVFCSYADKVCPLKSGGHGCEGGVCSTS